MQVNKNQLKRKFFGPKSMGQQFKDHLRKVDKF